MNTTNSYTLEDLLLQQTKLSNEILWSNIYHDTIVGSRWLKEQSFSPGRAAIGYPALYALYRVLDEFHPANILELGLGQSTKMIASYIKWAEKESNNNYAHTIVEHDQTWINFFNNIFSLPNSSKILKLDLLTIVCQTLNNSETTVNTYKDFTKILGDKKYDLIFIDGPFGSPEYSRIDIINLIPECLNSSFVLMLDDAERPGELKTLMTILDKLNQNKIKYAYQFNLYSGCKNTAVITSEDLHFFCTL